MSKIFALIILIIGYCKVLSYETIDSDSLYFDRILSNNTSQYTYLKINIQTLDYKGSVLMNKIGLYRLYFKELIDSNDSVSMKKYKEVIFDSLNNNKCFILPKTFNSLKNYGMVKIDDSIRLRFKDFSIENIIEKYFKIGVGNSYHSELNTKNSVDYWGVIYFLIQKRIIVFDDCSTGILSIIK